MKINGIQKTEDFWNYIENLIKTSDIIIDRPKGTPHPKFEVIYPINYGYLKNTNSSDNSEIDIWVGSLARQKINGIMVIVDLHKRDSEIKIIYSCTAEEIKIIYEFHNEEKMRGIYISRHEICEEEISNKHEDCFHEDVDFESDNPHINWNYTENEEE